MQYTRQLSRLAITSAVHENMPICVLAEIADAHGIRYDAQHIASPKFIHNLVDKIKTTQVPLLSEELTPPELSCIARFVNSRVQWNRSKLLEAYNYLVKFTISDDPLTHITPDFRAELQTPKHTRALNACVLYKICLYHKIHVHAHTSIENMAYYVRMLFEAPDALLRRVSFLIQKRATHTMLVNILALSAIETPDPDPKINTSVAYNVYPSLNVDHDILTTLYATLNDVRALRERTDPTTPAGAIGLAAMNYGIDISRTAAPLKEYQMLKIVNRTNYIPSDPWMAYWYQRNSLMFNLRETFNPIFPRHYYTSLAGLVDSEGYTTTEAENQDHYELLQMAYVSETFYEGEYPHLTRRETLIDDIQDVPYGELLCYGQPDNAMHPISVQDLIHMFRTNQNFTNPFAQNCVFSENAIRKLKRLAQRSTGPVLNKGITPETALARRELLDVITEVESFALVNDNHCRMLMQHYRNAAPDTKEDIRKLLYTLLHIAMYMRGWDGTGDFPVEHAPVPPEREPEVALSVTTAITNYERMVRSFGKLGYFLDNLPLVRWRGSEYQQSTSHEDGLTLGERIRIVKAGDSTKNIASCIRLSSNWLASSAHRYISVLGLPAPFNIHALRMIS